MTRLARSIDSARSLARKNPAAAIAELDRLRRENPRNPRARDALKVVARKHLASLLPAIATQARADNWNGALTLLRPLARAMPDNAGIAALAAEGLLAISRPDQALAVIERAQRHTPEESGLAALQGAALRALGDSEGALTPLRMALANDPGHSAAGNNLGLVLLDIGDSDGAVAAWRSVVAANPRAADTWMNLAPLVDFTRDPNLAAALEHAAAASGLSGAERECMGFAQATVALQRGDGDTAFACLHRANAARRKALGYVPRKDALLFDEIEARFGDLGPDDAASAVSGPWHGPRPILVTGIPRSGTTLTEQILAAHPMVQALGERDALTRSVRPHLASDAPRDASGLPEIARDYRRQLRELSDGRPVVTDKMPLNFRWIGPVLAGLPDARVVHLTRDPMAVGFSLYRHRFAGRGNGFAYDLRDIGHFARLERRLMAFWRDRWPADRLMILDYARLTAEPEATIRELLGFCGLPFHEACLAPHTVRRLVYTASAEQVKRPIYTGSTEAWRRWADHLAPLADALKDPVLPASREAAHG